MFVKEFIKFDNICIYDFFKEDFRLDNIYYILSM